MLVCSMSYSCSSMLVLRVSIVIGLLGGYHYCSCEEVEFTSGFMELEYLSRKFSTLEEANSKRVTVHPLIEQLRIVDSNQFSCDGEIIGFFIGASVKPSPMEGDNVVPHYPRAIIWSKQQFIDNDDGEDSLIRYYIKEHVELKPSFLNIHSQSGIYQYFLPSEPLRFQEGDVFGVHQPPPLESAVVLQYTTLTQTFDTLSLVTTATDVTRINRGDLKQLESSQYLLIRPIVSNGSAPCLQGFLDVEVIRTLAVRIGNLQAPKNELRLFPDITFTQSGYITSWTIGGMLTGTDTLSSEITEQQKSELQTWRPTANTSYYTRIEQYKLDKVDNNLTSHMFEYTVASPIPVMAGDILGVFQPSNSTIKIYYQDNNGPDNIVISTEEKSDILIPQTIDVSTIQIGLANDYPLVAVNVTDSLLDITPTVYSISGTNNETSTPILNSKTTSVIVSHQPSPGTIDSNTDLLLPLTLSGIIALLIIAPIIIIILIVGLYIGIKRKQNKPPHTPPAPPCTVVDTSLSNNTYATVGECCGNSNMQYNPAYLERKVTERQPFPPVPPPHRAVQQLSVSAPHPPVQPLLAVSTAPTISNYQNDEPVDESEYI